MLLFLFLLRSCLTLDVVVKTSILKLFYIYSPLYIIQIFEISVKRPHYSRETPCSGSKSYREPCDRRPVCSAACSPKNAQQSHFMSTNLMQSAHTTRPDVYFASNSRPAVAHAFSSGSVASCRRLAQRCHVSHVSKQRGRQIVHAAAATDVGTKAVQAIKKSVGGDIFVAGTS